MPILKIMEIREGNLKNRAKEYMEREEGTRETRTVQTCALLGLSTTLFPILKSLLVPLPDLLFESGFRFENSNNLQGGESNQKLTYFP